MGGSAAVIISDVYTPQVFYLQFKEDLTNLDDMMEKLQ
jgi:hypothetical protein